ncbi:MAG: hypothetical protein JWM16_6195 [Verrucomicrobiales bacterium]|nr:hypothetical protein [Verrucomicrobiales bacterium]
MIIPGHGTLIAYESATPGTYTPVYQIVSIDAPEIVNGQADSTLLTSATKKSRATIPDCGELSMTGFYDPKDVTHIKLFDLLKTGAEVNWQLSFNDAAVLADKSHWIFPGYVKSAKPTGVEVDGNLGLDLVVVLNDFPVQTPRT